MKIQSIPKPLVNTQLISRGVYTAEVLLEWTLCLDGRPRTHAYTVFVSKHLYLLFSSTI